MPNLNNFVTMYTYKLKYQSKEQALEDFELKKILFFEEGEYVFGQNIKAFLEIGEIESFEGYHYDMISSVEIDFGDKEIFPNNPYHKFL